MDDVWPLIFMYFTTKERYRYATVCSAWGKYGGLIDKSVSIINEEIRSHSLYKVIRRPVKLVNYTGSLGLPEELDRLAAHSATLRKVCFYPYVARSTSDIDNYSLVLDARGETLKRLTSLTSLEMTGGLSDDVIHHLPLLKTLRLCSSYLTDEGLSRLYRLETLVLVNEGIITGSTLSLLTNLRNLAISGPTCIQGNVIQQLTDLQSFRIGQNDYNDTHLSHLTQLRSLSVWFTKNSELTQQVFTHFSHLTRLECQGTSFVMPLASLSNIKDLYCNWNCFINDDVLAEMTQLESLRFRERTTVTGYSLYFLSRLTRLEFLHEEVQLDEEDIEMLPPSLCILHLSNVANVATLASIPHRLTNLVELSVTTDFFEEEEEGVYKLSSVKDLVYILDNLQL